MEFISDILRLVLDTWNHYLTGFPIIDYSWQSIGDGKGKYIKILDKEHFKVL